MFAVQRWTRQGSNELTASLTFSASELVRHCTILFELIHKPRLVIYFLADASDHFTRYPNPFSLEGRHSIVHFYTAHVTSSFFDLGGTVGSGVFVLTGLIAREHSGAGVVVSWLIAGFGCCFSAMSYAELSCRIPSAGSSYAYVYVALGKSRQARFASRQLNMT